MFILGIDPGYTGAIALYDTRAGLLSVEDMPVTKNPKGKTVMDYHGLAALLEPTMPVLATLELVAARPNQGAPSGFRFGEAYGAIQQCLACHKIPWDTVTPAMWKKHFKFKTGADKEVSIGYVKKHFPEHADIFLKSKDGRAEAVLLALYGAEVMWKDKIR